MVGKDGPPEFRQVIAAGRFRSHKIRNEVDLYTAMNHANVQRRRTQQRVCLLLPGASASRPAPQ